MLGGAVNGRRFYGTWPGLNPEILSPTFGDVPVTTDYRRVFSEIMVRRMANPSLGTIFPGYTGYSPLGIVQGTDLAPQMAAAVAMGAKPMSVGPSSPLPQSPTNDTHVETPEWQLRGPVDRMLTRRER